MIEMNKKWLKHYTDQKTADVRIVLKSSLWSHAISYAYDRVSGRVCEIGHNNRLLPVNPKVDPGIIADVKRMMIGEYNMADHADE